MYCTNSWPVDPAELATHLQAELDVELAWFERQSAWKAELAAMNPKARYRAKNTALLRYKQAMRRAEELNAVPPWLTEANKAEILRRYERAVDKELWTGEPQEVHHEAPLVGECEVTGMHIVCGLHVPWNLKVLERDENRRLGATVISDLSKNDGINFSDHYLDDGDDGIPW